MSWTGTGIVAVAGIGPQYQGLTPTAGTLVNITLRTAGAVGGVTFQLYNGGAALGVPIVCPVGPSTIPVNVGYPAGALRELRINPGLLATGAVDFTCTWRR